MYSRIYLLAAGRIISESQGGRNHRFWFYAGGAAWQAIQYKTLPSYLHWQKDQQFSYQTADPSVLSKIIPSLLIFSSVSRITQVSGYPEIYLDKPHLFSTILSHCTIIPFCGYLHRCGSVNRLRSNNHFSTVCPDSPGIL